MTHLLVIVPVFDDWSCFARLLAGLDAAQPDMPVQLSVLAVNDGSITSLSRESLPPTEHLHRVEILDLVCNLGHQRAIALGLSHAAAQTDIDLVAIMDGDGEDRPQDLRHLLAAYCAAPEGTVVVAARSKRSESLLFRVAYRSYKALFRLLTGSAITFGNFSLFSRAVAGRLAHSADAWNHLAAALLRSRLPLCQVPVERGKRYEGQSKLNFVGLLVHGLSAISVFADRLFVRLVMTGLALSGAALLGVIAVVAIRLFTDLAIPGWATYVAGILLIILLQSVMLSLIAAFLLLSNRTQVTVMPAAMRDSLILRLTRLHPAAESKP